MARWISHVFIFSTIGEWKRNFTVDVFPIYSSMYDFESICASLSQSGFNKGAISNSTFILANALFPEATTFVPLPFAP